MVKLHTITVFGGSGFLGRHIVRRLAKTGARIIIPTRDTNKALFLKPMGDVGQIVPVFCNTHNDASVRNVIAGSDVVINLLGILFEKGRSTFQSIHVETAARIARIAHEESVSQLVQLSALGASNNAPSQYSRSKAAGEDAVRMFFPRATIIRPSIIFGAEDNFFNRFARMAATSPFLPLIGGGHTKFQPVFVGDVADAVCKSLNDAKLQGRVIECGGPHVYSFKELLTYILTCTGKTRILLPLPWPVASLVGAMMGLLPAPPLTLDQIRSLKVDNVIAPSEALTLPQIGITPQRVEAVVPTYLQ